MSLHALVRGEVSTVGIKHAHAVVNSVDNVHNKDFDLAVCVSLNMFQLVQNENCCGENASSS